MSVNMFIDLNYENILLFFFLHITNKNLANPELLIGSEHI